MANVDYQDMLDFQTVYLQAIAESWCNPEFTKNFLDNPEHALQVYFGYVCPWVIDLSVFTPDQILSSVGEQKLEALGNPAPPYGWNNETKQWNLPRNSLVVKVPKAPVSSEDGILPVALSKYNTSGDYFLFTCCYLPF